MIKSIVFDFDGVIADTYQINYETSMLFDTSITEQDFKDHHNGNVFEKPVIKFKPQDVPIFFEKQRARFSEGLLFPLEKVLEQLSKKYQLHIISSSIEENINHLLAIGNYGRFFEAVYGKGTHTSKIEKFKMLFEKYDFGADECLFVTDTIGDIIEAREVGVKTIGVTWGYHERELLASQMPHALVHTAQELLDAIEING